MSGRAVDNPKARQELDTALREFELQAVNWGYRWINDSGVRKEYLTRTKQFSDEIRAAYDAGKLSAKQAAEAANQMRNELMDLARIKSSDVGRAKAIALKAKGLELAELAEKYAGKMFGRSMSALSKAEQDAVHMEIVAAAGRANPKVSAAAARLGAAGRGLWVLAAVVAVYNVGTAEYKVHAAGREAANVGGGFLAGAAAGAAAGIWFGPVGVTVGVVIGGVLGSIFADQVYTEVTGPRENAVRALLPEFTGMFHVDEEGLADALVSRLGIDLGSVILVFKELERSYTSDADDVALLYVERVQRAGNPAIAQGLKLDKELQALLLRCLEEGWTSDREGRAIKYLKSLTG
ncbi:MAG TPA: hypothetical protein VJU61_19020 [Polyangiaceae bacterium]|nr:hypothetical protein [Polyangiaceae bacterium]